MALRRALLDTIGKVTTPTFTEPTARIFVFDAQDDSPGFIAVYTAKNGRSTLRALEPIASFTNTRLPRRDPYLVHTLTDGPDAPWQIQRGGCGCGSPIKRLSQRNALDAYAQSPLANPPPVQSPEPVGG